jgi:polysaccharide biosynthesis/export protein
MRVSRHIVVVCTLCLSVLWAYAQSGSTATPVPQPDAPQSAQGLTANIGDEPVGDGDLVYLSVTGAPELTRSYRVSNEGQLSLPLVHKPIFVRGMAPAAIARAVTDALIRDRILVAPIVSAAAMEYKSRQVTVAGAVKAPTIIQATGDLKLLDAVTRAQGIGPDAGPDIMVSSPDKTTGTRKSTRIPIKELLAGKDSSLNISLHGGEEIRVPDAPKLFIAGNVRSPGIYRMTDTGTSSVLKAMALAQGTLPATGKEAYVYRVVEGSNERKEIAVPLRDILHRKAPDVQLQANDILYVPESTKLKYAKVLERLAGFGESVGSGLIIAHP